MNFFSRLHNHLEDIVDLCHNIQILPKKKLKGKLRYESIFMGMSSIIQGKKTSVFWFYLIIIFFYTWLNSKNSVSNYNWNAIHNDKWLILRLQYNFSSLHQKGNPTTTCPKQLTLNELLFIVHSYLEVVNSRMKNFYCPQCDTFLRFNDLNHATIVQFIKINKIPS